MKIPSRLPIPESDIEQALSIAATTKERMLARLAQNMLIAAELKQEKREFISFLYTKGYTYEAIMRFCGEPMGNIYLYGIPSRIKEVPDDLFNAIVSLSKKTIRLQTYKHIPKPGHHRRKMAMANCLISRTLASMGYSLRAIGRKIGMDEKAVHSHVVGKCFCPLDKLIMPVYEDQTGRIILKREPRGQEKTPPWRRFSYRHRRASTHNKPYQKPSGVIPSSELLCADQDFRKGVKALRQSHLVPIPSDVPTGACRPEQPGSGENILPPWLVEDEGG